MSVKIHGDNSASSCGFSTGDGDTGIMPGSDVVDVVTGGTSRIKAENATTTISNNLSVSGTRALVGTTTVPQLGTANPRFTVSGENYANSLAGIIRYQADTSGASLQFGRARGTEASPAALQSGDEVGKIRFFGHDGTDLNSAAATINCEIDGAPGSDDMPGRLTFETTADGASSATERMRISSTGMVEVYKGSTNTGKTAGQEAFRVGNGSNNYRFSVYPDGTTVIGGSGNITTNNIQLTNDGKIKLADGGGIHFHNYDDGTNITSNLLDDYEEGTWTPSAGGNATYTTQNGRYTKIGRLVTVFFHYDIDTLGTGSNFKIEGLPFTASGTGSVRGEGHGSIGIATGLASSVVSCVPYVGDNTSSIFVITRASAAASTSINTAIYQDDTRVEGTVTYETVS